VWVLPAGEGLLEPSVEAAALRLGKRGKKRVVVAIFVRELQKTGRPRNGCRSAPISKSRAGIKPGKCAANWVAAANAKGRWFGVRRRRAVSRLVAKSLAGANSASRRGSRSVDLTPLSGRQSTFAASSRISVGRVCMVPCAPVLGPDHHLRLISAGIIETSGANQEKLRHVVARRKHRRAAGRTKGPADDVPTLGGFVPEVAFPDKCAALRRDGPSNGQLIMVELAGIAESTARRAAMIEKFTGGLLSQPLWSAASSARRAALRLLPGLPDTLHPFSDVAGSPDRPRCHTNFLRHP
jgi:hypothetical protein